MSYVSHVAFAPLSMMQILTGWTGQLIDFDDVEILFPVQSTLVEDLVPTLFLAGARMPFLFYLQEKWKELEYELHNFWKYGLKPPRRAGEGIIIELEKINDSVYSFQNPPDSKAEIIFFHDIHWTGYEQPHVQTWMSSREPTVCWPSHWLGVKYPRAKIVSIKYDGGTWKKPDEGRMDMDLLAENLRQDILSSYAEKSPVFLIGHGLGGLLIKALIRKVQGERDALFRGLSTCRQSPDGTDRKKYDKYECFLKNVKSFCFYSTPCLGSKVADSTINFPNKGPLMDALESLSTYGCRLNDWFRKWRKDMGCEAIAIRAAHSTKMALWYGCRFFDVAEEASARSDVDSLYSASRDHFSVCKPDDKKDSSFKRLVELLDRGMPAVALVTTVPIDISDENVCNEILGGMLKEIERNSEQGTAIILKKVELDKIKLFPELFNRLMQALERAGYHTTSEDFDFVYCESLNVYQWPGYV